MSFLLPCRVRAFSPSDDEDHSIGDWTVSKKQCTIIAFVLGGMITVLGLVLLISAFPTIIEKRVDNEMDLKNPQSEGYKNFVGYKM